LNYRRSNENRIAEYEVFMALCHLDMATGKNNVVTAPLDPVLTRLEREATL
jgi:hypothetical protein